MLIPLPSRDDELGPAYRQGALRIGAVRAGRVTGDGRRQRVP
ncbi:hypothetical protein HMPREF1550_01980 [Actinomyces sp. oral taxon 877 str. F0543]|nr:hypothetical protein HMPREF1550_01980 [Actinomyces sp. oral taxon 877 str. F0543]